MALTWKELTVLVITTLLISSFVAFGVQRIQAQQAEREALAGGFWMTIARDDSVGHRLNESTLQSTQDYGDSVYAEIHQLTEHYRIYHAGPNSWLQVWIKP